MYGRLNEDVAWARLQDMQREMENRSLEGGPKTSPLKVILLLGERIWWLAGLAYSRPPRRRAGGALERRGAVRDVA